MVLQFTAKQHYDILAERGHWRHDTPAALRYMARWDGPLFFELLGDTKNRDLLEVGIGSGRIGRQVLTHGCRTLTGLDISDQTIAYTTSELAEFTNLELICTDIGDFHRPDSFDIAYSVLTLMHIEDKATALLNIVDALRQGGYIVLSIDHASEWLDFGEWRVPLYPWSPQRYAEALDNNGCHVDAVIPLIDHWVGSNGEKFDTFGKDIATLIKATKT